MGPYAGYCSAAQAADETEQPPLPQDAASLYAAALAAASDECATAAAAAAAAAAARPVVARTLDAAERAALRAAGVRLDGEGEGGELHHDQGRRREQRAGPAGRRRR